MSYDTWPPKKGDIWHFSVSHEAWEIRTSQANFSGRYQAQQLSSGRIDDVWMPGPDHPTHGAKNWTLIERKL